MLEDVDLLLSECAILGGVRCRSPRVPQRSRAMSLAVVRVGARADGALNANVPSSLAMHVDADPAIRVRPRSFLPFAAGGYLVPISARRLDRLRDAQFFRPMRLSTRLTVAGETPTVVAISCPACADHAGFQCARSPMAASACAAPLAERGDIKRTRSGGAVWGATEIPQRTAVS